MKLSPYFCSYCQYFTVFQIEVFIRGVIDKGKDEWKGCRVGEDVRVGLLHIPFSLRYILQGLDILYYAAVFIVFSFSRIPSSMRWHYALTAALTQIPKTKIRFLSAFLFYKVIVVEVALLPPPPPNDVLFFYIAFLIGDNERLIGELIGNFLDNDMVNYLSCGSKYCHIV